MTLSAHVAGAQRLHGATLNAELRQLRGDIAAVRGRCDLALDIEDLAVDTDVERPADRGDLSSLATPYTFAARRSGSLRIG